MTESEQIAQWTKWEAEIAAKVPSGATLQAVQDCAFDYWDSTWLRLRQGASSFDERAFSAGVFDVSHGIGHAAAEHADDRASYLAGRRAGERLLKRVEGK